jgi:hypothetical protein
MKAAGYIGTGVGCGVLATLVLAMANTDDEFWNSAARAQALMGDEPEPPPSDLVWELLALGLYAASGILVLVGIIGLGVRVGQRPD